LTDTDGLKVLLLGGDASVWIGVSSILGRNSSEIVLPHDVSPAELEHASRDVDAVVVAIARGEPDPSGPLRLIRKVGLHRGTVVIGDPADHRIAAEALALGVGGFVQRGSSPEHLLEAIKQVVDEGTFYDAPAAEILQSRIEFMQNFGGGSDLSPMSAARALASALELKDTYTGGHAERVSAMAMRLADFAWLDDAIPSDAMEAAFLLHDVGKIGIPETILTKPGGLGDTERRVLQTHPILGERIVAPLGFPDVVRQVIRHHHERWDGSGYPDGLAGQEIPAAARLFSIADALDAMTSLRPYRRPISFEEAIAEIVRGSGTQFDPQLCALAEQVFLETPTISLVEEEQPLL
jgi:ribonuclease P protein subunit RPR2